MADLQIQGHMLFHVFYIFVISPIVFFYIIPDFDNVEIYTKILPIMQPEIFMKGHNRKGDAK